MTVISQIVAQAQAQSVAEIIAVVSAIAYLVFAIRLQIICWLFAAISTAIYIWLFVDAQLYMESVLNGFYLVMAAYGWLMWNTGQQNGADLPVVTWALHTHLTAIFAILLLSAINGYLLQTYSDAAFPYIDSLTTWSAIWATFLVARKVFENWWYWLVIDIVSVFIYWSRDLQLTAALFIVYVTMIPFGFAAWRRSIREQGA